MKASLFLLLVPLLAAEAGLIENIFIRPIKAIRTIFDNKQDSPGNVKEKLEQRLNYLDAQIAAMEAMFSDSNRPVVNDISEPEDNDHHEEPEAQSSSGGHSHFGYDEDNGPETWPEHFPACGGNSQSPIDIVQSTLEPIELPPLKRKNYWLPPKEMEVENNGHTLEVSGQWESGKEPTISGGPLQGDEYTFQQMHIHWGFSDDTGSEHTVNGKSMPMEMHVVHYNNKYGSMAEALNHKDGIAVAGFFFTIGHEENPMLEKFIQAAKGVEGSTVKHVNMDEPIPINTLNLDFDKDYVTYTGSLTTPPCAEVVTWMVSTQPLLLSARQMELLRTAVKDSDGDSMHNYRPVQPLNGRSVYVVA